MARPSPNRATGVGIVGSNPDQSPSSETGRAVVNVQLTEPGRRTRGSRVSPVRPALPKLLRTSLEAVDPQGQCECCGTFLDFLQGRGSRPPPSEEKSTTFLVALDAGSSQGRTSRPSCISPVTEGDSETEGRYCPIGHCCNREETMKNQHLARLIGVAALGVSGLGGAGMLIPSLGATGIAGALPTCTAAGGTGLTASVIAA